ncbi:type II toxin-antitoxin system RelE family toxin [Marinactinospora rubrisoli]|uniref:Type II toxin-antitoxin system RelE/ParE family toxin n=1 Tax=Marinactinospora rubrisoli TaxID=2715399 RepID=A0ABW2KN71_9ACTN
MTIRSVLWTPDAQQAARKLPRRLREQVRDHLAALATGPIPPPGALPDLDVPDAYHVVTAELTMIVGVYPDEVRVWIVRANT